MDSRRGEAKRRGNRYRTERAREIQCSNAGQTSFCALLHTKRKRGIKGEEQTAKKKRKKKASGSVKRPSFAFTVRAIVVPPPSLSASLVHWAQFSRFNGILFPRVYPNWNNRIAMLSSYMNMSSLRAWHISRAIPVASSSSAARIYSLPSFLFSYTVARVASRRGPERTKTNGRRRGICHINSVSRLKAKRREEKRCGEWRAWRKGGEENLFSNVWRSGEICVEEDWERRGNVIRHGCSLLGTDVRSDFFVVVVVTFILFINIAHGMCY